VNIVQAKKVKKINDFKKKVGRFATQPFYCTKVHFKQCYSSRYHWVPLYGYVL